jgi:hypothetical protein
MATPPLLRHPLLEDSSGDIWFGCQMLCRWNGSSMSHYMQEQMDHPSGDGVVAPCCRGRGLDLGGHGRRGAGAGSAPLQ